MKVVLAGGWARPVYEPACRDALLRAGVEVARFCWRGYGTSLVGKAEEKWGLQGPSTARLNRAFVRFVEAEQPTAVLVWKGTRLWPRSLRRIRQRTGAVLVSYNHDDFSGPSRGAEVPRHHHRMWRRFLACAPLYDLHLVKREDNIEHLKSLGAKRAVLCPMYFVPEIHRPIALSEQDQQRYGCDAVFIGHHEPDDRVACLQALAEAGLEVRAMGDERWVEAPFQSLPGFSGQAETITGDEYAKALCAAQMCLCFLSKINRDTYTRRCMEIPACGKLLLSERSSDLLEMFEDGREAVFFSSPQELVERAVWLKEHPREVEKIAAAGRERVYRGGHSVDDRMRQFIQFVSERRADD